MPLHGPGSFSHVIGCRDRFVRVLGGPGGGDADRPLFEVATPSPPTALLHVADAHDARGRRVSLAEGGGC